MVWLKTYSFLEIIQAAIYTIVGPNQLVFHDITVYFSSKTQSPGRPFVGAPQKMVNISHENNYELL